MLDKDIDIYSSDMLFKPNLFAIKKRKPIIIDNSILNNLSKQEIRFFIFHEYSHIKDNDSFKMHITSLGTFTIVPLFFFIVIPTISLPTNFLSIIPFIIMFVILYFTGIIFSFKYKRSIELKCDSYASNYVEKESIKNAFQKFIKLDIFNYKKEEFYLAILV
ncbi:M48 family metalloprotease [Staphylococcus aureus]|uniref:M48 family metalloprotease n=1 Tax=Staphylococcus aureus TaxID=1280 RepID=UPI0023E3CA4C|nr:M48 family metalloprotease [Staphylococcus aureus]MDF4041287.1 M48 family metalloprotease [Staphylococcus aureus]